MAKDALTGADREQDFDTLNRRLQQLEELLSKRTVVHGSYSLDTHYDDTLQDGKTYVMKTRVFGQSHWVTTASEVCLLYDIFCDVG